MSKLTISPEEGADRLAIRELVEGYAHSADRRDSKGPMSLFTTDTHFVVLHECQRSQAFTGTELPGSTRARLCGSQQVPGRSRNAKNVDWEVELALVIEKTERRANTPRPKGDFYRQILVALRRRSDALPKTFASSLIWRMCKDLAPWAASKEASKPPNFQCDKAQVESVTQHQTYFIPGLTLCGHSQSCVHWIHGDNSEVTLYLQRIWNTTCLATDFGPSVQGASHHKA
jgi:hypothetical protein